MPAAKQINPTSRRSRLRLFFATNPGQHRARDVAKALGEPTQYIANECGRMAREGALERVRTSVEGRSLPVTTFGVPQPDQPDE